MTQVFILTGPESCGKTTLATALAGYWSAPLVEEQARSYLLEKGRDNPDFHYQEEDLLRIAERQLEAENHALEQHPARLICDTDLLVLMVWSEVKYGKCEPWIQKQFEHSLRHGQATLYFMRLADSLAGRRITRAPGPAQKGTVSALQAENE